MIELNGIYKLKRIIDFKEFDNNEYKIIAMYEDGTVICERVSGENTGERFVLLTEFFIDPETPEDNVYSKIRLVTHDN